MTSILGTTPTHDDSHGNESTVPVLVFADILRQHGPSVIISLWFTYWLTSQVSGAIANVQHDILSHARLSAFYSRQICINTAATPAQVALCEPPTERLER